MSTRRERLEAKVERREEWAEKADARSASRLAGARRISDLIPFGQPILVGHHSEKHHRRDIERIHNGYSKGFEEMELAKHHRSAAEGLASQLETSVFSDDADAIEKLEARAAASDAAAEEINRLNKAFRKGGIGALAALTSEAVAKRAAETMRLCSWLKTPLDATSERASARRDRERIEEIKKRQAKSAAAEEAGGVVVSPGPGKYCSVTFAEKPARDVLDALHSAGFSWSRGSWWGEREKVPTEILPSVPPTAAEVLACGCPVNTPEADPNVYCCPCGAHCKTCEPKP